MEPVKRVLDDVTRKKLEMLLPFGKDSQVRRVPDMFLEFPQEFQPVFTMGPFTKLARKYISDHTKSGTYDTDVMVKAMWDSGLRWENLRDAANLDMQIPCEEAALARFKIQLFEWLAHEMQVMTTGPNELEKEGLESLPQPTSPAESPKIAGNADVPSP